MIVLAIVAGVILISAAVALSLRNLVRSALLLVVSWIGIGVFFLWAGAEFLAFAQVLVYAGAISMVVLFAVLLTGRKEPGSAPERSGAANTIAAVLSAGAVAAVIAAAVLRSPEAAGAPSVAAAEPGAPSFPVGPARSAAPASPKASVLSARDADKTDLRFRPPAAADHQTYAPRPTVRDLGAELLGPQAAALLAIGGLLTAALLGAIVIAARGEERTPP